MFRNKDKGGQAEVVWTCHGERPGVCKRKDDGNGVTRKEKRGRPKRRFLDVVKDMWKVGVRKIDVENRMVWRNMICCGYP